MKRIIHIVLALLLSSTFHLTAQTRFGVIGGVGFDKAKFSEISNAEAPVGWNAGITWSWDLPAGFSIQPSVCYHQKEAMLLPDVSQRMGYIEIPLSIQWGPDLVLFRPLVDFTPYFGYAISNGIVGKAGNLAVDRMSWEGKQRWEYGLGVGGGIELWRFQLICRYNWNFGSLYDPDGWEKLKANMGDLNSSSSNFEGITLTLAFFF